MPLGRATPSRTARSRRGSLSRRASAEALEPRTLLTAGDLDPTFSGDGILLGSQEGVYWRGADAVAVHADGKVVTAGRRGLWQDVIIGRAPSCCCRASAPTVRAT